MAYKPDIFKDEFFIRCISLAQLSKGQERYGSILVKKGKIIGQGYNRAIGHATFRLERIIRQGYANHAEVEALNDALEKKKNVKGAELYCAGFFPEDGRIFFQKEYTCRRCPKPLQEYGISTIFLPRPTKWFGRSPLEADLEALAFRDGTHTKRRNNTISNHYIGAISKLLTAEEMNFDPSK